MMEHGSDWGPMGPTEKMQIETLKAQLAELKLAAMSLIRHEHPHIGSCVTYGLVDGRSMVTRDSCKCSPEVKAVREAIVNDGGSDVG